MYVELMHQRSLELIMQPVLQGVSGYLAQALPGKQYVKRW